MQINLNLQLHILVLNRNYMKILNKIILFVFLSINIFASGGSIYSRFGKGDVSNFYFARQMAIGGGGASLIGSNNIFVYNPASIAGIKLTRVETGLRSYGNNLTTNTQSVYYSKTLFSGFAMALPIERSLGIAVSFGIVPFTNVNYAVKQSITNSIGDDYNLTLEGSGGISKIFLGTSYRLPFGWLLGAQYEYYFGKIDYTSKLVFSETSSYKNAGFTNSNGHHGMGANFGLISNDMSSIFGSESISDFRIGAFFNYFANLHTDSTFTAIASDGRLDVENGSALTKIPYKIGIGASIKFSKAYLFTLDFLYQPWSQYEISGIRSVNLTDYTKYSLGFEYKNNYSRNLNFWERIALRAGLSYENTQYTFNGEGINQYAIHAGVGIPVTFSNNLDIGFMAGVRGTKSNNLIKEYFYKLDVSVSFGELWFVRQER